MKKSFTEEQLKQKKDEITPIALSLFLKRGVDDVKMTDIATEANIGVATLYRYFSVKKSIVIETGIMLWKQIYDSFLLLNKKNKDKDAISCLQDMMNQFSVLYKKQPSFFIFLRQFDSFCIKEKVTNEELKEYDSTILLIKDLYDKVIEKGEKDHTIKENIDKDLLYFTMTKAYIGLAQKLIAEDDILSSDQRSDKEKQLNKLVEIFMKYYQK